MPRGERKSSSGGAEEAIPSVHVDSEIFHRSILISLPFLFDPWLPRSVVLVSRPPRCMLRPCCSPPFCSPSTCLRWVICSILWVNLLCLTTLRKMVLILCLRNYLVMKEGLTNLF
nr:uncharacterized protein LOC109781551 [Aegilops tauschii subsp. strangulata]